MRELIEIDPAHTTIGFSVKHLAVSTVRGSFGKFEGAFELDREGGAGSTGRLTIETASLTTANDQRDGHLKSADFFEVEKYPRITWNLTGVQRNGQGDYVATGDLTIKDVTRPVELKVAVEGDIEHPFKPGSRLFSLTASGEINRMDFGLNWDGLIGALPAAGRQVKLNIDAEVSATPVTAEVAAQA